MVRAAAHPREEEGELSSPGGAEEQQHLVAEGGLGILGVEEVV